VWVKVKCQIHKLVIKITKKQQIQEEKLMDYKNSGVDIEAGYKSVELMKKYVQGTMRPEVLTGLGGFSGAFSMEKFKNMEKPTLVSGTDGVGTKLKLAFLMDKHDTIGIDCVAMCVNDIACAGGEPLFFLDYIACVFMMFAAPPDQSLEWSDAGVEGANRFLKRVWRLTAGFLEKDNQATAIDTANLSKDAQDLRRKTHETIQKVGDDIERRHAFNTSIAALMELLNATNKFEAKDDNDVAVAREAITTLLTLLAPFAPHLSQTLLAQFSIDINTTLFPQVDESALTRNTQTIVVQVNGKLRGKLEVAVDISKEDLLVQAKALAEVQQFLTGPTKKEIVVPNKLVNLVV
jgi:hypothetical protein